MLALTSGLRQFPFPMLVMHASKALFTEVWGDSYRAVLEARGVEVCFSYSLKGAHFWLCLEFPARYNCLFLVSHSQRLHVASWASFFIIVPAGALELTMSWSSL